MGKYHKILFLDIDGVLNSDRFYKKTLGRQGHFDAEAIQLLNQLKDIDVEVVISSSWGEDGVKQLKNVGLELPILGCTEHFHVEWLYRGNEIEKWLCLNFGGMATKYGYDEYGVAYWRKYADEDYEYVIFDDDSDFLLGQANNFVQVNRETGLTQEDIDKAIKILNREN